ncbi:MAG: hypothetical protein V2J89_12485, partial [Halieaceae bacterium]|nr:hypothetical protein [Halieaceae bacterium]
MSLGSALVFAPLVGLLMLPLGGQRQRWLLVLIALLPAATLLLAPGQQLPWVLLGTGLQSSTPVVAVIALQAALFAATMVPVQQGTAVSRIPCAWLLLAQCALAVMLLAQELLFVVTGFTAASYALLAARMAAANTQSPRLAPVAVVLVLGDL